jgi:hypothetical protein
MRFTCIFATISIFCSALIASPAWAGPPLICHPADIGSARSLPWLATSSWNGADPSYDVSHLRDDTLNLLTPSTPIGIRIETIRRAVIYATRQPGLSDQLTVALFGRVMNAEALGTADPSAWFDAGYYVETVNEVARIYPNVHAVDHVDGVSWMRTAIHLGGGGMQTAVATVEQARAEWHRH